MTSRARTLGLLALVLPSPSFAVEVELNPGDDVKSLTESLRAGDTFIFNDGQYDLTETVVWSGVGDASTPITFKAAAGAAPVLVGSSYPILRISDSAYVVMEGLVISGVEGWDSGEMRFDGLQVHNSSFVTLRNVEVRNVPDTLLYLSGNNSDVTVTRTHLHGSIRGHGVYVGCGNASCFTQSSLFSNNWIHDLRGDSGRGMELSAGSQNITVVDNVLYGGGSRGILTSSTSYGSPNIIERNAVWSFVGSGIRADGPAIVRNNVIFNINGAGLYSYWQDAYMEEGPIVFAYNTVVGTTGPAALLERWSVAGETSNVFSSNALTNATGVALDGDIREGHYFAGNVVTGLVDLAVEGYLPGAGADDYLDAEIWDFWPSDGSHLVGAGDPTAEGWLPTDDFYGQARPGDAPDTGAVERTGPSNTGWLIKEGFKELGTTGEGPGTTTVEGGCGCSGEEEEATPQAALALPLYALAVLRRRRRA